MDLYVPIFAIGRMPGWIIQCIEQLEGNILIRPLTLDNGAEPRDYVALSDADRSWHMQELLTLTQTEFTLLAVICFWRDWFGVYGFCIVCNCDGIGGTDPVAACPDPICWWLELVASAMMVRGGWKDADKGAAAPCGWALRLPCRLGSISRKTSLPNCPKLWPCA